MAARTETPAGKSRFGLGEKMFLAFSAAALVPIIIALFSSIAIYLRNMDGITQELVREKSRSARLLVIERAERMTALLDYASGENGLTINIDLGLDEAAAGYLANLQASSDIDALWVISADGALIRSPVPSELTVQDLSAQRTVSGSVWTAGSAGRQFIVAARELRGTEGRLPGMLYGAIEMTTVLEKIATELSAPVFLAAPDGRLLSLASGRAGKAVPDVEEMPQIGETLRHERTDGMFSGRLAGIDYLFDVTRFTVDGNSPMASIGAGYPDSAIADARQAGLFGLVASSLAMLLLSAGVSVYFTRTITGTARKIALSAREIAGGNFGLETGVFRNDELGDLAAEFDRMSRMLREQEGERKKMERAILETNSRLEATVETRTVALRKANGEIKTTLANLEQAQNKIVEAEKLSVLGQLAAGIAHELNTPLGAMLSSIGSFEYFLDKRFYPLADVRAGLTGDERGTCERILEVLLPQLSQAAKLGFNRSRRKELRIRLEETGIPDAQVIAEKIADWDIEVDIEALIPLLAHERSGLLLDYCGEILTLHRMIGITALSAQKAVVVVNALRSYLHPENQDESCLIDIDRELDNILILMKNKIKPSVEIKRDYGHATTRGSPEKLGQVWINLINNAVEAMHYKGVLLLSTAQEGGFAVVKVIDDGPGIPPEIREKIFEPFFSTKPQGEGLGLGLDICKKIISGFGGSILVESRKGNTCFTVRIPGEDGDEASDTVCR